MTDDPMDARIRARHAELNGRYGAFMDLHTGRAAAREKLAAAAGDDGLESDGLPPAQQLLDEVMASDGNDQEEGTDGYQDDLDAS